MSGAPVLRAIGIVAPALLLAARGGPSRPGGIWPAGPGGDTLTTAYEVSGLRVIQRFSQVDDVVAVRLYLLGGTRQVTERTAGIEALLLRAGAYGTAQFPRDEARRALDRTGAITIIEPELDWTVFGFTGLVGDLDVAWRVLADRLMHPTLAEEDVAQARAKLLTESHRRYTEPDERLRALAMRALFTDHPYALDPAGTETSLAALTTADLKAYARDQLVTSRILLAVVGNVTRVHVESLVTATLGQLPRGDYHWVLPPAAPSRKARWLIEHRPIPTTYMLGLFAGPPPTSRSYWAFRVATALLSSRLHSAIRTQRGLSYAAYAPYLEAAVPVGGAYVSTPRPDQVLSLVIEQIQGLEGRELDYFGLSRFIDSFGFRYVAENATASGQADLLARAELYLGSYRTGDEFVKRLHNVSPSDVRRVAAEYMPAIQFAYLGDTTRMHGHW
jgi:zinc protease